jgi:hypothetical protein
MIEHAMGTLEEDDDPFRQTFENPEGFDGVAGQLLFGWIYVPGLEFLAGLIESE